MVAFSGPSYRIIDDVSTYRSCRPLFFYLIIVVSICIYVFVCEDVVTVCPFFSNINLMQKALLYFLDEICLEICDFMRCMSTLREGAG